MQVGKTLCMEAVHDTVSEEKKRRVSSQLASVERTI
jgi:hypothetical protein